MYPSLWQILIILLILLLLFGHKRIREFGKSLGEGLRDFKKGLEGGTRTDGETREADPARTDGETREADPARTDGEEKPSPTKANDQLQNTNTPSPTKEVKN